MLHAIHPYTYLGDVLQRDDIHPQRQVVDLTPRMWKDKFEDQAMPSPALAS